jgi:hypothetical protein
VVSLLLHSVAPAWLGRTAIVALGVAAGVAAMKGRRRAALLLGVASFVWVARAWETLALVFTISVVELVGVALARRRRASADPDGGHESSLANVLLLTVFAFALLYVQRIAITGSLDFEALDWGAATFGDAATPAWVVGSALVFKFVLAELLVLGTLGSALAALTRARLFAALVVAHAARAVLLLAILLICSKSYWTTLRVVGDLPFALTAMFAAGVSWVVAQAGRWPVAGALYPKRSE